jgi:3-phenylpropionate/cinnamic acid dioxygenase small subunit
MMTTATIRPGAAGDMALHYEVEQFLFAEAALLDARRYEQWLGLLAEDIHYWMPIRRTVTLRDIDREFTKQGDMAFFDENYALLGARVRKLGAGSAWSEDPPSRSRHFVTNIRITAVEGDEISVSSCFCVYRTRLNTEIDHWTGRREDRVRRTEGGLLLARRHLFLDQTLLLSTNLSTLF